MEPMLHCARPARGCEARLSARVLACALCHWFREPQRSEIVVFNVPNKAKKGL
jgi:hypothetical protein